MTKCKNKLITKTHAAHTDSTGYKSAHSIYHRCRPHYFHHDAERQIFHWACRKVHAQTLCAPDDNTTVNSSLCFLEQNVRINAKSMEKFASSYNQLQHHEYSQHDHSNTLIMHVLLSSFGHFYCKCLNNLMLLYITNVLTTLVFS